MRTRKLAQVVAACLLAAVLAPVAFTGAIRADDWADLVAPVNDSSTPGPELYGNQRYDDDIISMPDLIQTAPASPIHVFAVPHSATPAIPNTIAEPAAHTCLPPASTRAPPEA